MTLRSTFPALTRDEVKLMLSHLKQPFLTIIQLACAGMREAEILRLRVKDIDFERRELTISNRTGGKDRRIALPVGIVKTLQRRVVQVEKLYARDVSEGFGTVEMPNALRFSYESRSLLWQFVFAAPDRDTDPTSREICRPHLHPTVLKIALKTAALNSGLNKRISCQTFRRSCAAFLFSAYDSNFILLKEFLGHPQLWYYRNSHSSHIES